MQNVGANLFLGLAGAGIDAGQTYMEQRPKTFGPKEWHKIMVMDLLREFTIQ